MGVAQMSVFWDLHRVSIMVFLPTFGETCCLQLQSEWILSRLILNSVTLKMEAAGSSERRNKPIILQGLKNHKPIMCVCTCVKAYESKFCPYSAPMWLVLLIVMDTHARWPWLPKTVCLYATFEIYLFFGRYCSLNFRRYSSGLCSVAPFPIHFPSFKSRKVAARTIIARLIAFLSRPL
jgi:hypothetical protein